MRSPLAWKSLRWMWWAARLNNTPLPPPPPSPPPSPSPTLLPSPPLSPFILHVQGQAWLYKCYLIAESFPMPRFGGEINLWLKYWRAQNLSSEARQSGNKGGGVGSIKKKEKRKRERRRGDKHNQSDGVTLGFFYALRRGVGWAFDQPRRRWGSETERD